MSIDQYIRADQPHRFIVICKRLRYPNDERWFVKCKTHGKGWSVSAIVSQRTIVEISALFLRRSEAVQSELCNVIHVNCLHLQEAS